jgi:hypothetical protein
MSIVPDRCAVDVIPFRLRRRAIRINIGKIEIPSFAEY